MNPGERLQSVRSKLEARFGSFENALWGWQGPAETAEPAGRDWLFGAAAKLGAAAVAAVPAGKTAPAQGGAEERIKALEEAGERLRENLRVMGTERQEIANQLHAQEAKAAELEKKLLEKESENAALKGQLERLRLKRERAFRVFGERLKSLRSEREHNQGDRQKAEEMGEQVARLTSELDAALELVAELRDELQGVGQGGSAGLSRRDLRQGKRPPPAGTD